jgi:hypothetical protein
LAAFCALIEQKSALFKSSTSKQGDFEGFLLDLDKAGKKQRNMPL